MVVARLGISWHFLASIFAIVFSILFATAQAIYCYECKGPDNECTVGLLGEKTECSPDVKFCYKSWTVEHWPMTKRKCADVRSYEDECRDVLWGQLLMLACYCSDGDYCNTASEINKSSILAILGTSVLVLFQRLLFQ